VILIFWFFSFGERVSSNVEYLKIFKGCSVEFIETEIIDHIFVA